MTMANPTNLPGDLIVPGDVRITGSISPGLARDSCLALTELAVFPIPLTSFRVWDDMALLLPSAGATDDLGLVEGTFGSATPSLRTEDLSGAGATLNYARALVHLPWCYADANTVILRFHAGMITTASDGTAVLDCEVYKLQDDPDDAIGSDLIAASPSQVDINSLVFADADFTVTASSLVAGDVLDVRIVTAVNDAVAGGTAVIAGITSAKLLCDVR
jgi:hypothetical protein